MKYLIVDDHALITGALTLMLEDRDPEAEVHSAQTARDAIDLVMREGDADLLILDLSMPDVTGTELMEEIVRLQPMLKILVVSGLADQESIMRVLQLGAAGFVPKSLDTELLGNAIDFVLKGGVFIPSKLLTESQRSGFLSRTAAHLKPAAEEPVHLTERQGGARPARAGRAHQADLPGARLVRGHRQDPRRGDLPRVRSEQPHGGAACGPPRGI